MFQRNIINAVSKARVARQIVQFNQRRNMSAHHDPIGPHLLGTRQSDYIQPLNLYRELPSVPGSYNEGYPMSLFYSVASTFGAIPAIWYFYKAFIPVRVDVEKVTVEHPDTKEDVFLMKPTGIHRDSFEVYGYELIQQPQLHYSRFESIAAERMARYNDEMDFWLKHGENSQEELGRPFKLFNPKLALVTDRQDFKQYYTKKDE